MPFPFDRMRWAMDFRGTLGFRSVAKNKAGCSRIDAFIDVDEHANDYVGFVTFAMEAVR